MTTTATVTMFYIGNFADMDTNESDWVTDNPNVVLGTHGDLAPTSVTEVDVDDDGIIYDDEYATGDYIEYDLGGGTTPVALDSSTLYNATILLGDGSSIARTVLVIQSANGDVFIAEYPSQPLDGLSIQSITLNSVNDPNGAGINRGTSNAENTSIVCFGLGSRIRTPDGERAVEDLRTGDLVETLDHGPQRITWTDRSFSMRPEHNAPIVFAAGALGNGTPETPLLLSPQHRVLLRSRVAERMYLTPEVLVPARYLVPLHGVRRLLSFLPATYFHFACENHEIVFANGAQVETFLGGETALRMLGDLRGHGLAPDVSAQAPVRPLIGGKKARRLIDRHLRNNRALQAAFV